MAVTIVVARRFGDRIIVASDTMVSREHDAPPNIIPGRLKAVVLSTKISVAYAGLSLQAIDAIRAAKRAADAGGGLAGVEAILATATARHRGELDFIIAAHENGPELKKVIDGSVTRDLHDTAIGQTDLLRAILDAGTASPKHIVPSDYEDEIAFSSGFIALFNEQGVQVAPKVGGLAIFLLASPHGHTYNMHASVAAWDVRQGGVPETAVQRADRRSGMTEWQYQILSPSLRGVAVAGAMLPSAGLGIIYSPLEDDEATRIRFDPPTGKEEHAQCTASLTAELDRRADAIGGGVLVDNGTIDRTPPTSGELDQILAHAATAPFPTKLTRVEHGFQVECGDGTFQRMTLLAFSQMQPRPVEIACETIDRINAAISESVERARLGSP